jgi:hypothetical protein
VEWEVVELWLCCQLFGANSGKQRRTEVHVGRHRMDRTARIVAGEGKDMTDREELEFAAKAAGLLEMAVGDKDIQRYLLRWNPLTDDGDALRLAVRLNLQVEPDSFNGDTIVVGNLAPGRPLKCATEPHKDDPQAATRRAITRAAAEIGRSMS